MSKNLSKRHRAEKRFIAYGFISLILAATMLATIIGSMIYRSISSVDCRSSGDNRKRDDSKIWHTWREPVLGHQVFLA